MRSISFFIFISLFLLSGCGGGGDNPPESSGKDIIIDDTSNGENSDETPDEIPITELPLAGEPGEVGDIEQKVAGETIASGEIVPIDFANAEGELRQSSVGAGNFTLGVSASDPDGLGEVILFVPSVNRNFILCSTDCGNNFQVTLTGINPQLMGASVGSIRFELFVGDTLDNLVTVDSTSVDWQPIQISSISASRSNNIITVNWASSPSVIRYNLYAATEQVIDSNNILNLNNGVQQLAILGTSSQFSDEQADKEYRVLLTGINSEGESGQSAIFTIPRAEGSVNQVPIAQPDNFNINEDQALIDNVLSNDTDGNEQVLTLSDVIALPANGIIEFEASGQFIYTPSVDFVGQDSFIYQVSDSEGASAQANVTIIVNEVNDNPIAHNDSYVLNVDKTLTIDASQLLANDTDVEGDNLTVLRDVLSQPSFGSLVINDDGSFSYSANNNYIDSDSFIYQISDGMGGTAQASVFLLLNTSNQPPIARNNQYQINEDNVLSVGVVADGILANDTDPNDRTFQLVTPLAELPSHGQVNLALDGTFSYIPDSDFFGADQFKYQIINSLGVTAQATVSINVIAQADAPVSNNDIYQVNEDTILHVLLSEGVLANDSDTDLGTLIVNTTPVSEPSQGSLTLQADGSFSYTANANFTGVDSFSYQVSNESNLISTSQVFISVSNINDVPVAVADSYSVDEDITLNAASVLTNDTDADSDNLVVDTTPVVNVTQGSLTLFSDGTFTYVPKANSTVNDSFTYSVTDNNGGTAQAVVTLTINAVNDIPTITVVANDFTEDNGGLVAGTSVAGSYTTDDRGDGDLLTISFNTASTHYTVNQVGNVFLTNAAINVINAGGTLDTIDLKVTDNNVTPLSSTSSDTPVVIAVNDVPVAVVDSYSVNEDITLNAASVLTNDTDADVDILTVNATPVDNVSNGSLTLFADGTFTYIPTLNSFGSDSFTYSVTDNNGGTAQAVVTLTINAVNDAPTITVVANDFTEDSGGLVAGSSVAGSYTTDDRGDGDTLTISFNTPSSHYTANQIGNIYLTSAAINVINAGGTLDAIDLKVTDNNVTPLSSTGSDTPVVTAVNDTPTITVVANDFTEDSGGLIAGTSVAGSYTTDNRGDGDLLTISFNTASTHYIVDQAGNVFLTSTAINVINAGGTLDTIDLKVTDNNGTPLSSTGSDTPVVTTANDTPTITVVANDFTEDSGGLVAGSSVAGNYTKDDLGDGDTLTISFNTASTHYTLDQAGNVFLTNAAITVINAGGTLDTIELKVTDDNATPLSSTGSDTPVVTAVNDTPTITVVANDFTEDSGGLIAGTSVAGSYTTDNQGDGDLLTISFNTASTHYIVDQAGNVFLTSTAINVINAGGTLDTIDLKVTDNNGTPLSSTDSDTPVVTTANDTPTIMVVANDFTEDSGGLVAGSSVAGSYTKDDLGDGDTLTISFNTASTHYTLNQAGNVFLTNAAITVINAGGTLDTIDLKVTDDNATPLSSTGSDTPVVTAVNDKPIITVVANDFTENSGGLVAGSSVAGSYTKDDLGDGDTLTISFNTASTHYTLNQAGNVFLTNAAITVINAGGTLDTIDLKVTDDNVTPLSSTGSDTPVVTAVNDAPMANDDTFTMSNGFTLSTVNLLTNDTDADADNLTISTTPITPTGTGTLILAADGSFTYTPVTADPFTFSYQVMDGNGGSDIGFVTITVNSSNTAPVGVADNYNLIQNHVLNGSSVLGNDTDADANTLTVNTTPTVPTSNGVLTLNADGSFIYTPIADFVGSDGFTYELNDGNGGTATAAVSLTINANSAPTITVVANDFTEDSGGLVAGTSVVGSYATDDLGDGDTLIISFNTASTHYTVNQSGNVYLTSAAIDVINVGGTLDTIDLKVTDDNATPLSSTGSDTPVVTAVNDTPTISVMANDFTEDSGGLVAGTSVAGTYTTDDLSDGDTLIISFNTASTHYTVNQSGDVFLTSTAINVINAGGTLDTIDLKVTDDNATPLSSTGSDTPVVTAVNDTPTISVMANDFTEDSGGLVAGTSVAGSYTKDDLGDGDTLTISFNTASTHYTVNQSGDVFLTSAAINVINAGGTLDTIDLKVTDDNATPLSSTGSDTPVVTAVNDTPTITVVANDFTEDSGGLVAGTSVAGSYTKDDLGDGDTLIISFNTASTHYTVNQSGDVLLTSTAIDVINVGGILETIDLKVTDDNATPLSSTGSDTPVVTAVNDTPTITVVANDFSEDNGGLVAGSSVAGSYTKDDLGDGDTLIISFNTASTHYTVNQSGDVYLTSAAINVINVGGTLDTIDLKVTDDNVTPLSSTGSDTPVVTAVNDTPTITVVANDFTEDSGGLVAGTSVAGSYTTDDLGDGDTLTISFNTASTHYTVNQSGDVFLTSTAIDVINVGGTLDTIDLKVTDDNATPLSSTGSDTPVVAVVNDTPTILVVANDFTEDSGGLVAGTSVAGTYTTDNLGDGDTLTISFNTASTHYTLNQAGNVYLTSAAIDVINVGGTLETIDLKVTDDNATPLSSTGSDTPVVTTVNDTPTITVVANDFTEDSGGLVAGTSIAGTYTTDDLGDGDALTISFNTGSTHYTVNQTGDVLLTSTAIDVINVGGTLETIDLKVTDDNATPLSSTGSDTPVVTMVNDAPTAFDQTFNVDEDKTDGDVVGTVVATDIEGDDLSYAIIGGDGALFNIDSATGTITVSGATPLNFENLAQHALSVEITDDGSPNEASVITVTIDVNNVIEPVIPAELESFGRPTTGFLELTGENENAKLTDSVRVGNEVYFVGYRENIDKDIYMVVYEKDGQLHPSFGTNGVLTLDFGHHETVKAIAESGGKYYLAFESFNGIYTEICFIELNGNGDLDIGNGINGVSCTDEKSDLAINDMIEVGSDLWAVGRKRGIDDDLLIIQIDNSLVLSPIIIKDINDDGLDDEGLAILETDSNEILIAGNVVSAEGDIDMFAWHVDENVVGINTFNSGDPLTYDISGNDDVVHSLSVQGQTGSNFIAYMAGYTLLDNGMKEAAVVAINELGEFPTNFLPSTYDVDGDGSDGSGYAEFTGIEFQDSSLYLGGTVWDIGASENRQFAARITAIGLDVDVGTIDTSYGSNGYRTTNFAQNSFALSMSLDGAKTTWLSGYREIGSGGIKMVLSAVNSSGNSFEGAEGEDGGKFENGKHTINHTSTPSDDLAVKVIKITNGDHADKFLVASVANANSKNDIVLTRFTTNGELDTTFDNDGHKQVKIGDNVEVTGLIELTSGEFVIYGNVTESETHGFIAKLDESANLDSSFATNGIYTTVGISATKIIFNQVAIDNNNSIVAVGGLEDDSYFVLRLNSTGNLDNSFNSNGYRDFQLNYIFNSLAIDASNNIIAAGYRIESSRKKMEINKFTNSGSFDNSFSDNGKLTVEVNSSADDFATRILVDSDSNIYLVGDNLATPNQVAIVKLSATGEKDINFNDDGIGSFVMAPSNSNASVKDAILDSSNNIIVVGSAEVSGINAPMIGRIKPDGTLDSTLNSSGFFQADTCNNVGQLSSILLLDDENLVVAGQCFNNTDASLKNDIELTQYQLLEP